MSLPFEFSTTLLRSKRSLMLCALMILLSLSCKRNTSLYFLSSSSPLAQSVVIFLHRVVLPTPGEPSIRSRTLIGSSCCFHWGELDKIHVTSSVTILFALDEAFSWSWRKLRLCVSSSSLSTLVKDKGMYDLIVLIVGGQSESGKMGFCWYLFLSWLL